MVLTLYSDFFSLLIFGLLLIPSVILGFCEKNQKWCGIITSFFALMLIFGLGTLKMLQFVFFLVFEMLLVKIYFEYSKRAKSEFVYFLVFLLSIIPIFIVKFAGNIDGILNLIPQIANRNFNFCAIKDIGFIGISYISFKIWQVIIEIHDGHIDRLPVDDLFYFVTFFPAISSGPIDRYKRFTDELHKRISRKDYFENYFVFGVKKFFLGIVYKFTIATAIQIYVIDKVTNLSGFLEILIYMYAYTFYLFFDFAGYSNFAIGTGALLGIKLPENFNKPFLAHNMKEFWERWHISLSKWLGDYVFSRFTLNTLRNGTFKNRKLAMRCAYMLTMLTMGIWHGFYLHYFLYGLYHGIMLVLTDVYIKSEFYKQFKKHRYYSPISIFLTFNVMAFGLLIFSGHIVKI